MPALRSCLLVSDLHLNANSRDAYRWEIWKDLAEMVKKFDLKNVVILGDLTTEKDFHSAHVVNGIVRGIMEAVAAGAYVHILKGNHDGIDPNEPYFGFLHEFESVHFYSKPRAVIDTDYSLGASVLMYPHVSDLVVEDRPSGKFEFAFTHLTVSGAISDTKHGRALDGYDVKHVENFFGLQCLIFSGDVHKPQIIGSLEYVGAPYHVRFGDSFPGRVIVFDNQSKRHDIVMNFPVKVMATVSGFGEVRERLESMRKGDHAKFVMTLSPSDLPSWQSIKARILEDAANFGVEIHGIDLKVDMGTSEPESPQYPADDARSIPFRAIRALEHYAKQKGLTPEQARLGHELYSEAES